MTTAIFVNFVAIFTQILVWAIIIRALFGWFNIGGEVALFRLLFTITEPILAPIRRLLPSGVMIDFSPLIAIILIQVINQIVIGHIG